MGHITANADTLLRQASMTATEYFETAVNEIDNKFGDGYSKKNPELIAAFMGVAASDMNTATLAKSQSDAIEYLADSINSALRLIADAMEQSA